MYRDHVERVERFFTMKSLADGDQYEVRHSFDYIAVRKNRKNYLSLKNGHRPKHFILDLYDVDLFMYVRKKWNHSNSIHGESMEELVLYIEKYLMEG